MACYVSIQIWIVDVTYMLVLCCMLYVQNEYQLHSVLNSSNEIHTCLLFKNEDIQSWNLRVLIFGH